MSGFLHDTFIGLGVMGAINMRRILALRGVDILKLAAGVGACIAIAIYFTQ